MRKETHADYLARLATAKETYRQNLLRLAGPFITHLVYLEALLDCAAGTNLERIRIPANVGTRIAAALMDDVEWLRAAPPDPGFQVSAFPNAYHRRLAANAQAAARRAHARVQQAAGEQPAALAELLNLDGGS